MPQVISHENQRIAFRISSEDKAILTKAAELSHTNMTEFMLQLVSIIWCNTFARWATRADFGILEV